MCTRCQRLIDFLLNRGKAESGGRREGGGVRSHAHEQEQFGRGIWASVLVGRLPCTQACSSGHRRLTPALTPSRLDTTPGRSLTVGGRVCVLCPLTPAASAMSQRLEGYLLKKSYITYRSRYFVLDGSNLMYKAAKEDAKERNLMTLAADSTVIEFSTKKGERQAGRPDT